MAGRGKIENLRPPWRSGESGNPNGRPKKRPITDEYEWVAAQKLPEALCAALNVPRGTTYGRAAALAQFRAAIRGKAEAAREIREAIEGKATQRIALTDSDGDDLPPAGDGADELAQRISELTDAIRDRLAKRKRAG